MAGLLHWWRREGRNGAASAEARTPVVLVHGFAQSVESWDAVLSHARLAAPCAGLRVPGHHPDVPLPTRSFETTVDWIAHELAGLGPIRLVGYSLGGRLSLSLCVRHPALVRSLTLIGTNPGLPDSERAVRREQDLRWARLLREQGIEAFVDAWQQQPIFASQDSLSSEVREAQRRIRLEHAPGALADAMEVLGLGSMPNYGPALSAIAIPTRIVVGARDAKHRVLAARMAAAIAGTQLVVMPGAGHNPLIEAPASLCGNPHHAPAH